MKNDNEFVSMAPWLFGTSIFSKEADNAQALIKVLETHPIDAFCASPNTYQMIESSGEKENEIRLQQLFSFKPISSNIKTSWFSLTNLMINDSKCIKNTQK